MNIINDQIEIDKARADALRNQQDESNIVQSIEDDFSLSLSSFVVGLTATQRRREAFLDRSLYAIEYDRNQELELGL